MSIPDANAGFCVGTLRIRAAASSDARALRHDLDMHAWPSAPDGSWVLLRRLGVQGPRGEIARRAAARVDGLVRSAVDGSASGAGSAAAVRFRSLGELLAELCSDLASGRAASLWYWRSWSALFGLPAGGAIASLLDRHPEHLTTLSERLDARGSLGLVWGSLSDSQALMLQGRLGSWLGLDLPAPTTEGSALTAIGWEPPPARLVRRWKGALSGLSRGDGRRSLAACLVALEWRPVLLGPGAARWLARVSSVLAGEDPSAQSPTIPGEPAGPSASPPRASSTPAAGRSEAANGPVENSDGERGRGPGDPIRPINAGLVQDADRAAYTGRSPPAARSVGGGFESGPADFAQIHDFEIRRSPAWTGASVESSIFAGEQRPGSPPSPMAPSSSRRQARSGSDGDRGSATSLDGIPQEPVPIAGDRGDRPLETDQGGLFYLVNFLSRPEAQALIAANEGFAQVPDGWHWLWDLGRRHGLSDSGPLAGFLAERLSLGDVAELADLPAVPGVADLLDLGQRLYAADNVWGPDLLLVPARVYHSPSHLEVDLPLSAVRLPVRLVGLDVDPGWVPWLGRVVHFRYLDDWRDAASIDRR